MQRGGSDQHWILAGNSRSARHSGQHPSRDCYAVWHGPRDGHCPAGVGLQRCLARLSEACGPHTQGSLLRLASLSGEEKNAEKESVL